MGCVDKEALDLVARVARSLEGLCKSAVILLTLACPQDGHGTHVSAAIASRGMAPSEARALCRKLRALADELEQRHAPAGREN
jgi:hypothetical protein